MLKFIFILISFLIAIDASANHAKKDNIYYEENDLLQKASVEEIKTNFASEITQIETYLNSFATLQADFRQTSQSGQILYGRIYIEKPGKIRCEYIKPSSLLLIINQAKLTYYDRDLDELTYSKFENNSFKFIASEKITFKNLPLILFQKTSDKLVIGFLQSDPKLKLSTKIYLHLSYPQISLEQLDIDNSDNVIYLSLSEIVYNQKLIKDLFYFNR